MVALSSAEDSERIIEATRTLVSTEKNLRRPPNTPEATETSEPTDGSYTIEPEMNRGNQESNPDHNLALKSKGPYFFFLAAFAIWLVSLLGIYLPVSGWMTPSFPLIIDNTRMTVFLVSASLASFSSDRLAQTGKIDDE